MTKNLVIVESPAKAKTIEGFLGKEYTVKSSYGHVRDLNKNTLSVNVEKDFAPEYEISDDKKALVAELRKLSNESDTVWLASDEDREGESISWHLYACRFCISFFVIILVFIVLLFRSVLCHQLRSQDHLPNRRWC